MSVNHTNSQLAYAQSVGITPTNYPILADRDPTSYDVYYKIGQFWINNSDNRLWYLNSQSNVGGILQSTWELIFSSDILSSLSDTSGTVVIPSTPSDTPPNNIQLYSSDNSISIVSDPSNFRINLTNDSGTAFWQTISANQTLVKKTGYICISPGGSLSLALPTTASSTLGDIIEVTLDGATSWTITQAVGQQIRIGNSQTTSGVGGSITTTAQGNSLRMVYQSSGKWNVVSFIGNLTVV